MHKVDDNTVANGWQKAKDSATRELEVRRRTPQHRALLRRAQAIDNRCYRAAPCADVEYCKDSRQAAVSAEAHVMHAAGGTMQNRGIVVHDRYNIQLSSPAFRARMVTHTVLCYEQAFLSKHC